MSASWTEKRDRFGGLGVYTIIYLAFIYGPVLVLPLFSFNDSIYVTFPLKGFTLEWYHDMINNPGMIDALMNSLKVGGTVAILSTILGTLAAKAMTRVLRQGTDRVLTLDDGGRLDVGRAQVTAYFGHNMFYDHPGFQWDGLDRIKYCGATCHCTCMPVFKLAASNEYEFIFFIG